MSTHIKDFLDNEYTGYAVYRVYQRLPHIIDSLGQTQRKILYVMEGFPDTKKSKTAEVYSHVYNKTQYLHGDKSVYTVTENMARGCSSNIALLTEEGNFGHRTNTGAASPRYTSTRFSKSARFVFRKEDQGILLGQEFEGKPIEPQFMLPIVPVSLINGFLGIAVGFSSKYLSRDPEILIDEMIRSLRYRKKHDSMDRFRWNQLPPKFPYYNGNIIHNTGHENPSAWIMTGVVKKTKTRNIVEITEVPPSYTRESYLKKLKQLLAKDIIKDFTEECRKNSFYFRVKLPPELGRKTEDEILDKLKLTEDYVENFTFIDPRSTEEAIRKFDTAEDYLRVFMEDRQYFYTIRRQYQLDKLKEEIEILYSRIRFIGEVNAGDIIITKRKKKDLEQQLKTQEYKEVDDSYDYLLGMRMHALTEENIIKFKKFIKEKELDYKTLEAASPEDIHIHELQELKKSIQPEIKKKTRVVS